MRSSIKDVLRFGPAPLSEITARVSQDNVDVASEINQLSRDDLITISREGSALDSVTPEDASSEASSEDSRWFS